MRLVSCTCRHRRLGAEVWDAVQQRHGRAIVAVWHESAVLAAYYYRGMGMHTLASYSFDAELAARAIRWLGTLSVRGSSHIGGSDALRDLAFVLGQQRSVGLTVDGPRGPRRVAKPGAAILAARTGVPIIPQAFAVTRAWRLHSWDRLQIAKPFACILASYGTPIPPPENTDPDTIEETRLAIETGINQAHRQMEEALSA